MREIRRVVTGALEVKRKEKTIGSSLEASVQIYLAELADVRLMETLDMAELTIASEVSSVMGEAPPASFVLQEVPGISVLVGQARGEKCSRCWQRLRTVGSCTDFPDLCQRCVSAVSLDP